MQRRFGAVGSAGVGSLDGIFGAVAVATGVAGGWFGFVGSTGVGSASLCEGRTAGEDDVAIGTESFDAIVSSWLACSAASLSSCASGAKELGEEVATAAAGAVLIEGTGDEGQERARRRLRERRGP